MPAPLRKIGSVDLDQFARRLVQDALTEATVGYWRRRADTFDSACSVPGEYTGAASAEEVAERDERLRLTALA